MKAGHFDLAGSWTSRNKNAVFLPKFKSAANFSAPAQEGNLFFLSGRSARKKIHNFPIKSSHLCRTSRHVWLSSSACDHCWAYQLICIMAISTYTTSARAEMTRQIGFCAVKKWVLAPVAPRPPGIPSTSSSKCKGSMEIFWQWYLCNKILQEHLLDRLLDTCTWECKITKIIWML